MGFTPFFLMGAFSVYDVLDLRHSVGTGYGWVLGLQHTVFCQVGNVYVELASKQSGRICRHAVL